MSPNFANLGPYDRLQLGDRLAAAENEVHISKVMTAKIRLDLVDTPPEALGRWYKIDKFEIAKAGLRQAREKRNEVRNLMGMNRKGQPLPPELVHLTYF